MELAIPGIALGLMYIIKNQPKPKTTENFAGKNDLPNVNVPNPNYPNESDINNTSTLSGDVNNTSALSTVNRYNNDSGTYTDKYFNQNSYKSDNDNDSATYTSLTGNNVNSSYFESSICFR